MTTYASEEILALEALTITGATQANPCALTITGHPLETGHTIRVQEVVGMTELNNAVYTVTKVDANTVSLDGIDSTAYTAYTSGGVAYQLLGATQRVPSGTVEGQNIKWAAGPKYPAGDGSDITNLPVSSLALISTKDVTSASSAEWLTGIPAGATRFKIVAHDLAHSANKIVHFAMGDPTTAGYTGNRETTTTSVSDAQNIVIEGFRGDISGNHVWLCTSVNAYNQIASFEFSVHHGGGSNDIEHSGHMVVLADEWDRIKLEINSGTFTAGKVSLYAV